MGWLYMQSLKGHSGPREYLDAQFTFERPEERRKCYGRRSSACASTTPPSNRPRRRRARGLGADLSRPLTIRATREGYIFGYKDSAPLRRR